MATETRTADASTARSRRLLEDLFAGLPARAFDVRFWDGSVWPGTAPAEFTLVVRHPGAVRAMFWPPSPLTFTRAYVYDDYDVEGDMRAFQDLCEYLATYPPTLPLPQRLRLAWRIWTLPRLDRPRAGRQAARPAGRLHSRERDREVISYHYDLPDVFYETILDPAMQYTSAVFGSADEGLEAAQARKLDLVCRKLRLKPGARLLDVGCGWGGLAMFAARNYGVTAVGVTLSRSQAEWARGRVRAAGLEGRVRIELADYRDLPEAEPFDHISTIEVSEHFGAGQLPTYFGKCHRLLRPAGTVLHQQITLNGQTGLGAAAREFMQHFVFPDAELLPLDVTLRHAERAGFEVRDVEGFREHYSLTLRHWLARVEANEGALTAATDAATYRVFRLYFAGAAFGFDTTGYNVHQVLLVKPDGGRSGLPLGRTDWYGGGAG